MGLPKAWLRLEGRPILGWLMRMIKWPGPTLLVSAPGVVHPPGWELFDAEVADPADGGGPLRGVLTTLQRSLTPMAVVVTVDMPCVAPSALVWLAETLSARPLCGGVMCRVTAGDVEHIEPFPSAWRAHAAGEISRRLEAGRRSVHDLCGDPAFPALRAPAEWPAETWTNLNTPADLAAFESTHPAPETTEKI